MAGKDVGSGGTGECWETAASHDGVERRHARCRVLNWRTQMFIIRPQHAQGEWRCCKQGSGGEQGRELRVWRRGPHGEP